MNNGNVKYQRGSITYTERLHVPDMSFRDTEETWNVIAQDHTHKVTAATLEKKERSISSGTENDTAART